MNSLKFWAVVPAAGIGERMQADRPKQYLPLENKTVIEQTLHRLASHPKLEGIIVALDPDDVWWPTLSLSLACPIYLVDGGEHRADSVLSALKFLSERIDDDPWVLVHDAARPCLRLIDIDRMLNQLSHHDVGGILAVPVIDTVKRSGLDNVIVETIDRANLWRAVTPQMFRLKQLKSALTIALKQTNPVTDEASAIEYIGLKPMIVEGHKDNIKITVPHDLAMASWFLEQQRGEA